MAKSRLWQKQLILRVSNILHSTTIFDPLSVVIVTKISLERVQLSSMSMVASAMFWPVRSAYSGAVSKQNDQKFQLLSIK